MPDPEIKAIGAILDALEGLTEDSQRNVLLYVNTRFGFKSAAAPKPSGGSREDESRTGHSAPAGDYKTFDALYDAANPQTQEDKALVGGYWAQVSLGGEDFDSQSINTNLKDLGHGISNVTRALGALEEQTPVLVRQVKKSGTTKQARKRYKLTAPGIKRVEQLIAQHASE